MNETQLKKQLDEINAYFAKENPKAAYDFMLYLDETVEDKFEKFRAFCNVRPPLPLDPYWLDLQDTILQTLLSSRTVTALSDLTPVQNQLYLWQGDITTLAVDAIVNAANSDMLGCTQARHDCIDNAIHTRSGIQLRLICHEKMQAQGHREPMGKAYLTPAYNLPSQYIIHTVGPYIDARGVTSIKENLLRSAYRNCLEVADGKGLKSIAFCCISTGEFNYPNQAGAEVAIATVKAYLKETKSKLKVIFNVYLDQDQAIYHQLLQTEEEK